MNIIKTGFFMRQIAFLLLAAYLVGEPSTSFGGDSRYLFSFTDRGYFVTYDINNNHERVYAIRVMPWGGDMLWGGDTRGMAVSKISKRAYCFYNTGRPGTTLDGRIACIDISNPRIPRKLWDVVGNSEGVDRGDVSLDGTKLFVPTFESNPTTQAYNKVLNAATGEDFTPIQTIPTPARSHNTFVSVDGSLVWMENKDGGVIAMDTDPYNLAKIDGRIRAADTDTNQVVYTSPRFLDQGPYAGSKESGTIQPFTVTSDNRYIFACVKGTYGYQWVDRLDKNNVVHAHNFTDTVYTGDTTYVSLHGLGMKPDETELWVVDNGTDPNFVHVVDITDPYNPVDKTQSGGGARVVLQISKAHWLTFGINGQYAYVLGRKRGGEGAEVIDTSTYTHVASIAPTGAMAEVDYDSAGEISVVGNQVGLGRGPSPSPTPTPTATPNPTGTPTSNSTATPTD